MYVHMCMYVCIYIYTYIVCIYSDLGSFISSVFFLFKHIFVKLSFSFLCIFYCGYNKQKLLNRYVFYLPDFRLTKPLLRVSPTMSMCHFVSFSKTLN